MPKHSITFYPLENADSSLIKLENGKSILFDYANKRVEGDPEDKRIDLPKALNEAVKGNFDVVCFTHADDDHIFKFSEYFFLNHAEKYQGGNRKKIKELWVPAATLLEKNLPEEARILRSEARHRLKEKKGILVFSRPEKMKDWCDEQDDISYEEVKNLFIDAGKLLPGFTLSNDGIEFFVHSPFASKTEAIDRNCEAIVVQATFNDKCKSKLLLGSDITYKVWEDIIKVTKRFNNKDRLLWDIFHISHHCSYTALSEEKGTDETEPSESVKWLYETQGRTGSRLISPSKPIPTKGSKEDQDNQPPHRQAANYYKKVANKHKGEFKVTIEFPNIDKPEPMVIEINEQTCATLLKKATTTNTNVKDVVPPRAG